MNIEIVTTKKKITKAMIKQFEPTDWKYINSFFTCDSSVYEGKLFIVRDVFKWPILIFQGRDNLWRYFPWHKYVSNFKKTDVTANALHQFINDERATKLFLENVELIKKLAIKIII